MYCGIEYFADKARRNSQLMTPPSDVDPEAVAAAIVAIHSLLWKVNSVWVCECECECIVVP